MMLRHVAWASNEKCVSLIVKQAKYLLEAVVLQRGFMDAYAVLMHKSWRFRMVLRLECTSKDINLTQCHAHCRYDLRI